MVSILTNWKTRFVTKSIVEPNCLRLLDINIEEVSAAEETLEEETGADIFGSDDLKDSEDDYDEVSEESEVDECDSKHLIPKL